MSFKCGFYSELDELRRDDVSASFGFLENLRVTSESSAFNFLHGCCDEFAAMLSDVFGYEIECVRNADGRLIHAYCISNIGPEKVYIDIRGITTDPELFFSEFKNELYYYSPTGSVLVEDEDGREIDAERNVWVSKNELFEGEYEGWDDPEVMSFIKDYADYYDSDQYISIYKCRACRSEFEEVGDEDGDWFDDYGEEALWGHLQLDHPDIFKECCDLETPDMLQLYYAHTVVPKAVPPQQSLAAAISSARSTLNSRKNTTDPTFKTLLKQSGPPEQLQSPDSR